MVVEADEEVVGWKEAMIETQSSAVGTEKRAAVVEAAAMTASSVTRRSAVALLVSDCLMV